MHLSWIIISNLWLDMIGYVICLCLMLCTNLPRYGITHFIFCTGTTDGGWIFTDFSQSLSLSRKHYYVLVSEFYMFFFFANVQKYALHNSLCLKCFSQRKKNHLNFKPLNRYLLLLFYETVQTFDWTRTLCCFLESYWWTRDCKRGTGSLTLAANCRL